MGWIMYVLLSFPIIITHIAPFIVAYCWMLAVVFCVICLRCMCLMDRNHEYDESNRINRILQVIGACAAYFFVFLWPVATMSRLYDGNNYIYTLYSVFGDRKTSDYIQGYIGKYHSLTQWILWFL